MATLHTTARTPDQVFRTLIEEGFNHGHLDALHEIVAPDLIEHQVGAEPGLDGLKSLIAGLRTPFPDLNLEVQSTATDGEMVWARLRARGNNTGPFYGRLATGRSMDITVIDVVRVADGRIVEHWGVADRLTMLEQLGIRPEGR
jgi:predicted ester cyclase